MFIYKLKSFKNIRKMNKKGNYLEAEAQKLDEEELVRSNL